MAAISSPPEVSTVHIHLDISVSVEPPPARPSVTKRLARQASTLFPNGSVKSVEMNVIAKRALEVVINDVGIPSKDQQRRAVFVMKTLLTEAGAKYPDSALQSAVAQAANEIAKEAIKKSST